MDVRERWEWHGLPGLRAFALRRHGERRAAPYYKGIAPVRSVPLAATKEDFASTVKMIQITTSYKSNASIIHS